jgi:O-antigen/teichoic acid export membrane protein
MLAKIKSNIIVLQSLKTMFLRVIGIVTLFGFTLFLTHNYDPKIIGQYEFIRVFMLVLGSICLLGTEQSILYFSGIINSKGNIGNLKNIYIKMTLLILAMSLLPIIVLQLVGKSNINSFFNDQFTYSIVLKSVLIIFFYCLTLLNTETFRALNSIYISELFRNTFKYVSVIIGAIALLKLNKEIYLVDTFLIGFIILSIVSTFMIIEMFNKKIKENKSLNSISFNFKEIFLKSYPMAISGMAFFLIMSFDIMFIKKHVGNEAVAFYTTAMKIMTILSMIIISVNINVSTKISEYFASGNKIELAKTVKNSSRLIFFIAFPLTILICLFSNTILNFFGKGYNVASESLIILMIGQVISAAFGSAPIYLNMTGRQGLFRNILIGSILIDFILNLILTPIYGINGTAIAFITSSLFWIFTSTIFIYKKDKINVFIH